MVSFLCSWGKLAAATILSAESVYDSKAVKVPQDSQVKFCLPAKMKANPSREAVDLRGPWTARRSNQSILKEISPEYSLEGLVLKLKLQYFGHLIQRTDSLEKTLMLRKIEGRRRRG